MSAEAAGAPEDAAADRRETAGPTGRLAVRLIERAREAGAQGLIHVADGEERAETLAQAVSALAPELEVLPFPPWDCLPYDRAPPSREVMGRRVRTLQRLWSGDGGPRLILTTPAAALQRTPPREALAAAVFTIRLGDRLDPGALRRFLLTGGYRLDERVDEPGEAAIRGLVVDLFPADADRPRRVLHDEDWRVSAIHPYDPVSQRSEGDEEILVLGPASEVVSSVEAVEQDAEEDLRIARPVGVERHMAAHYGRLETLFDAAPKAGLVLEPGADERRAAFLEQVADAWETRRRFAGRSGAVAPPPSEGFYLTEAEWKKRLRGRAVVRLEAGEEDASRIPRFAARSRASRAFVDFVEEQIKAGRRVALAAVGARDVGRMARPVERRMKRRPRPVADWRAVVAAEPGALLSLEFDLDAGFLDPSRGVAVVASADLLGSRARHGGEPAQAAPFAEAEPRRGDVVVHVDHGLAVLEGLETVEAEGAEGDLLRLRYARDATLMVPVEDIDRVWRYGSDPEAVTLDRLDSGAWEKRRAELEAALEETARTLIALAKARAEARAPKLEPPARAFERFVARFPFDPSRDQARAIEETLRDLARERPMDRLVCGDVGFGKTEVALRAAAAAALSGRQVAVIAPTTVLARQHYETFRRRFAGFDVEVGHLSRLTAGAEADAVREGLQDGRVRIVVGTHAVGGDKVRFKELGLVVIDEEQHFGTRQKERLRALGEQVHVLTMTATPIPRTLQAALVGLQDVSVIATPPARRQPIRTFVAPFDPVSVREALLRERDRGGQSFIVCPRIEDIAPMRERLGALAPELDLRVAHGKMAPEEIDETMVGFAGGEGDALLSTNIVESGLDVPCANTILIWRADRFGVSQLHQLRGRVGRGRVRGVAYLLTDPEAEIAEATFERLRTLEALDRLGAGFAIAARDLDQRGAGDLLGEEQAGHVKLIGLGLYQRMLEEALARVRGEARAQGPDPEVHLGLRALIPRDYAPDPEMRLSLYARIARLGETETPRRLLEEIEDRLGPPPGEVKALLARVRLKRLCRTAGVARLEAGPKGVALTLQAGLEDAPAVRKAMKAAKGALERRGDRLVLSARIETPAKRYRRALALLERLQG